MLNLKIMKNILFLTFIILTVSCQTNETQNKDNKINLIFSNNCKTVKSYIHDFANESIDYKKYYNDTCKIRGTYFNSQSPMNVEDRRLAHKEMWVKYDFSFSDSIVFLPGVNIETKEIDGSVRFYCDFSLKNTENGKTVTLPIYQSYDFDNDGKFIYLQYFGDFNAAISSIE